ncbi:MAG TPA: helix-turn-helix domain-containing protein, partial [Actinopolymorphaceae bacterium]
MPDILGLDRYMHEAYRILVRERQCTAARVAAHLGISRPDAEETLRRLETVGLAAQCGDDPRQLVPVDPQHTLGAALAKRQAKLLAEQQEVSKVRDAVSALASLFAAHNGDGRTGKSEVSHGTDAVRARVEGLVAAATSTIVGVVDEGASSIAFGLRPEVIETSIARGVAVRVLYPRTAAADPRFVTQSRWLVGAGGRVRAGRCLPPPMIIVDGSTTLLPADGT